MNVRDLDKLVRIERPVANGSFDGAGSGTWTLVDEVWAQVQDMLPSRGEKLADGVNIASRPARVRIRRRDDVDTSMRIVHGSRVMQITAGPAEYQRDFQEYMTEQFSIAGNGA